MKTYSIFPTALLLAALVALPEATTEKNADTEAVEAVKLLQDEPGEVAGDEEDAVVSAAALLERIEQAAAEMQTLRCRVRYTRVQGLLGDEQRRFGDLFYAAANDDEPTRFAIHLDGLVLDDRMRTIDQWFIYDSRFLLERNHDDQTATRREIRSADAENEETLALDSGTIPIPLRLKKDDVLAQYDAVQRGDETVGDWTLHHLELTPKQDAAQGGDDPAVLHLWFDSETLLLTKVVTVEGNDQIELLFAPSEMQPNAEIAPGTFDTTLPDEADGWDVQDVPLE
ncbi:MAG: outer membrane lipoprotein carrier protein LolA [Phycisphaerales bacterium JB063]